MDRDELAITRRTLHAVGELVIAGPQYRAHGTIRLRPTPGGFAGTASGVGVEGGDVVRDGGRVAIDGRSCRDLASEVGTQAGAPAGLYHDGSGVDVDESLRLYPAASAVLVGWLADGDAALRMFEAEQEPVLWPEHFDLAISVGEVNYGVSLGDGFHAAPYAYVGPSARREGAFWNAPFGAVRAAADLGDVAAIADFFAEGRAQAS